MLGVKLKDKFENIKKKLNKNKDFLQRIRKLKLEWSGHVARQQNKATFWTLTAKKSRGKLKTRWRDEINRFLGQKLYCRVAYDKREWGRLRKDCTYWLGQLYDLYEY